MWIATITFVTTVLTAQYLRVESMNNQIKAEIAECDQRNDALLDQLRSMFSADTIQNLADACYDEVQQHQQQQQLVAAHGESSSSWTRWWRPAQPPGNVASRNEAELKARYVTIIQQEMEKLVQENELMDSETMKDLDVVRVLKEEEETQQTGPESGHDPEAVDAQVPLVPHKQQESFTM